MVILDTNIIIDHLRKTKGQSALFKLTKDHPKELLGISMLTIHELYEGESTKDPEREKALLATISPLKILPYTYEIAELAGKLARDLSSPLELADAAIAATAIINGAKLYTLDKKDYQKISDLELL